MTSRRDLSIGPVALLLWASGVSLNCSGPEKNQASGGDGGTSLQSGDTTGGAEGFDGTSNGADGGSNSEVGAGGGAFLMGPGGQDNSNRQDATLSETCISVTGAGQRPWHALRIVGSEFDANNGSQIRAVIHVDDSYRSAVAEASIVNGTFDFAIADCLNDLLYVNISLYIDGDDDDSCDANEQILAMTTGIVTSDYLLEITPNSLCTTDSGGNCELLPEPMDSCNSNGKDLGVQLACESF